MTFHRHVRPKFVTKVGGLMIVFTLLSFSLAFVDSIWAVYLNTFIENMALLGIISAAMMFLAFILYFALIPYFESQQPTRTFMISLIMYALVYIFFALNRNFIIFIILTVLTTIAQVLKLNSSGIIIRNISSSKTIGKTEGLMFNVSNIAWLVGPLVAGLLADRYHISSVFFLAAIFVVLSFISFILFKMSSKMPKLKKLDDDLWKNALDFFTNKKVMLAYLFKGGVGVFLSTLYIYMPVYIIQHGLGVKWVGYFLFAIVIPLVVLEYYLSQNVEQFGYRNYFMIGFGALALFSFVTAFFSNIYWIMGVLIVANIFLAFIEPTSEAYFFRITKKREEGKYYGPFCTSTNLFGTIGRVLAAGVILILPFKFIFVLLAVEMAIFFMVAVSMKRVVKRAHINREIIANILRRKP